MDMKSVVEPVILQCSLQLEVRGNIMYVCVCVCVCVVEMFVYEKLLRVFLSDIKENVIQNQVSVETCDRLRRHNIHI